MELLRELELLDKASAALKTHESPFNRRFLDRNGVTHEEVGELCEAVAEAIDKGLPHE